MKARRCVFLGYPFGQKAYKLYDLTTKKIFTSRGVVFHESIFPFITNSNEPANITPDGPPVPIAVPHIPIAPSQPVLVPVPSPVTNSSSPSETDNHNNLSAVAPAVEQPIDSPTVEPIPPPTSQPPLRKSTRTKQPPAYLQDYVCSAVALPHSQASSLSSPGSSSGTRHPLCNYMSYRNLSLPYQSFIANLTLMQKLPKAPTGRRPWPLNFELWKPTILSKEPMDASGCTK